MYKESGQRKLAAVAEGNMISAKQGERVIQG